MNTQTKEQEIDKIERDLCLALDEEVYLPVKQELEKVNVTYSLGKRKEDFKGIIHQKLKALKQLKG
jgi:hypothetical protein